MGGSPLLALNLVMFSDTDIPAEELSAILKGGYDAALEAGCIIAGGHTIKDHPPKYGMAVVGIVHPQKVITNAKAKPGDNLILTKPLGTGIALAAQKLGICHPTTYNQAIESMCLLNKYGASVMHQYKVNSATDITGFSMAGHALKMAQASNVSIRFFVNQISAFDGIYKLIDDGCIPGAVFRNMEFTKKEIFFPKNLDYKYNVLAHDAQTSGGLLISCPSETTTLLMEKLHKNDIHKKARIIGSVTNPQRKRIYFE
jgi:selenide, water dikinase